METKERFKLIAGNIEEPYLSDFEALREEMSMNGSIKISEGSVIKFLLYSRKTNLARIAELEKAIRNNPESREFRTGESSW